MSDTLTYKQKAFVEAFLGRANGNATEAARIAGYSPNGKSLRQIASENLSKPDIQAAIKAHYEELAMPAAEVLGRLAEQARGAGGWSSTDPYSWYMRQLPGSQYDYRREAGLLWENSIVLACINWKVRTMPEAPLCVQQKKDGKWIPLDDHPAMDLLSDPNQFYDQSVLWGGTFISWDVAGNAYWYKSRSQAGKVVELIYIPHWHIRPMWPQDGSK